MLPRPAHQPCMSKPAILWCWLLLSMVLLLLGNHPLGCPVVVGGLLQQLLLLHCEASAAAVGPVVLPGAWLVLCLVVGTDQSLRCRCRCNFR